jgi:hypothetical protein
MPTSRSQPKTNFFGLDQIAVNLGKNGKGATWKNQRLSQ